MISIIVPTYNEEEDIGATIKSLLSLETKNKYEIIMVDSRSDDGTLKMVENYYGPSNKLKIITLEDRNISKARNVGISSSRGNFIFFIDSGFLAPKNWIDRVMVHFENKDIAGFGGSIKNRSTGLFSRFKVYDKIYREGFEKRYVDFVPFTNAAFRKDIFDEVGLLDESFYRRCEDSDLCYRISDAGHKLLFDPGIKVTGRESEHNSTFLRSSFLDGYWHLYLYLKHKGRAMGDSYRKSSFIIQPLVWFIILASLANVWFLALALVLLFASNVTFLRFCCKEEKSLTTAVSFYLIILTRTFFQFSGFVSGVLLYPVNHHRKKNY